MCAYLEKVILGESSSWITRSNIKSIVKVIPDIRSWLEM